MKTIQNAKGTFSGEFVRNYGKSSVQVRLPNGTKETGTLVVAEEPKVEEPKVEPPARPKLVLVKSEEPKEPTPAKETKQRPLGVQQEAALKLLAKNPSSSYREIAKTLDIPIPRAARVIKSLIEVGRLTKEVSKTGNTYKVI